MVKINMPHSEIKHFRAPVEEHYFLLIVGLIAVEERMVHESTPAINGTGIPEEIRRKIFEPFYTTKPAGKGTGLGLSLSHDIIVKTHGGELTVNSREGEGTEFVIRLPGA